jgi:hypothetical protein
MELKYTIPVTGLNAEEFVGAFALQHGWKPLVKDAGNNDIANPETALEYSRLTLNKFIEDSIKAFQSVKVAEAARQAALNQAGSALDSITTTLVIE